MDPSEYREGKIRVSTEKGRIRASTGAGSRGVPEKGSYPGVMPENPKQKRIKSRCVPENPKQGNQSKQTQGKGNAPV